MRYAGRVGTGFSESELERLASLLAPLERESSPFTAGERPPRGSVFCEPRLVAEVEFTEWTAAGSLRHPHTRACARRSRRARSCARGARPQSEALVIREQGEEGTTIVEGRELKLSNLGKALYPDAGFSKRDVIDFYAAVADVMVAHLQGRALTVKRWPDGVEGRRSSRSRRRRTDRSGCAR